MSALLYIGLFVISIGYLVSLLNYLPERIGNLIIETVLFSVVIIASGVTMVKVIFQ